MMAQYSKTMPPHVPFWFKPVSTFGLLKFTAFFRKFTYVGRTHSSLAPLRRRAGRFRFASRLGVPDVRWLHIVPSASHRAVAGSAWLGRERLMEQPVSSGRSSSCETETQATCRSHEHALCQIDADRRNLHDGCPPRFKWSMTLPLWHIDAVAGGGVHPIAMAASDSSER